jgi:hypothetical protein
MRNEINFDILDLGGNSKTSDFKTSKTSQDFSHTDFRFSQDFKRLRETS